VAGLLLKATSNWHYQKTVAYNALCNLNGVRGVNDKIVVRPTSIRNVVKAHIESALRRTFGRRTNRITVETRRDHVICGAVSILFQSVLKPSGRPGPHSEFVTWKTTSRLQVQSHR
jgi:hypothetical protein